MAYKIVTNNCLQTTLIFPSSSSFCVFFVFLICHRCKQNTKVIEYGCTQDQRYIMNTESENTRQIVSIIWKSSVHLAVTNKFRFYLLTSNWHIRTICFASIFNNNNLLIRSDHHKCNPFAGVLKRLTAMKVNRNAIGK